MPAGGGQQERGREAAPAAPAAMHVRKVKGKPRLVPTCFWGSAWLMAVAVGLKAVAPGTRTPSLASELRWRAA